MKGIDYGKVEEYLSRLEIKKSQQIKIRKLLKSQDSKNRVSSRQDLASEYGGNHSDYKFG